MFARFDENPAMTLQVIKKKKTLRTHARTDNVKTVYPTTNKVCGGYTPPQTKFAGGIKIIFWQLKLLNVALRPKYECVARPGNASEFYFHFHIHKLEADYQRNKVGGRY